MAVFHVGGYDFYTKTETPLKAETLTPLQEGEICEYLLHLEFDGEVSPSRYTIGWQERRVDVMGVWSPMTGTGRSITADWGPRETISRTACGMPLTALFSESNENRLTIALSDTATPTSIQVGTVEENGNLDIHVNFFTVLTQKRATYDAILRIDRRREVPFATAVREVRKWWEGQGLTCAYVPEAAKLPMYSTWYSYHQLVFAGDIIEECKLAKSLGLDTVIVDDGWQTDDNNRGYAYCGDWKVATGKIPDMKTFVDQIHALGMKVVLWYSVPFMGEKSENFHRFEGKYLYHNKHLQTYVLDPRFREVREFLTQTYVDAVKSYGLDGLKLDFIDNFKLTPDSPQNVEEMDTLSVEEGVELLLAEATEKLRAVNSDIMIEFRQPYVGPIVAKYGNMFRVGDCPSDPILNRVSTLDLRLTSGTSAVHSDMVMWHKEETPEAAALQLYGVLFSVPQISVRIATLTEAQEKMLRQFIHFWLTHKTTLLEGDLEVGDVQANYSYATAKGKEEYVTALYQTVVLRHTTPLPHYIVNVTGKDDIYVETTTPCSYEIYDILDNLITTGTLPKGITHLPVPNGGSVKLG